MNKGTIIKRLTATIAIISLMAFGITKYIPIYVANKIYKKAEEKGFDLEYSSLDIKWNTIRITDLKLYNEKIRANIDYVDIYHELGRVNKADLHGGDISYLFDNKVKLTGNSSPSSENKHIEIFLNDVKVNTEVLKAKVELEVSFANVQEQSATMKRIVVSHEYGNASLLNIEYKDKKLEVGEATASVKGLVSNPKAQEFVKSDRNKHSPLDYLKLISVKKGKISYGKYRIEADNLVFNPESLGISSSLVSLHNNDDKILGLTSVNVNKDNETVTLKALSINTFRKEISKDDFNINNVTAKFSKDNSIYYANLKVGGVSGDIAWDRENAVLSGALDPVKCQDLISSIPSSLKESLEGFEFTGNLAGEFKVNVKDPDVKIKFSQDCKSVKSPTTFSRNALRTKFNRIVVNSDKSESILESGPSVPGWKSIENISKYMPMAVLACEDAGFYGHKGISIQAIENSIEENIKARKFIRGGSTITMQTVKNLWLNRQKTIDRKIQEAFLTFHLENTLTKDEIMETYLNIVELSPGEYGIGKASEKYFSNSPSGLSLPQSIFLALMLPNPRVNPWDAEGKASESRMKLVRAIVNNIKAKNKISEEEYEAAMNEWVTLGGNKDTNISDEEVLIDKEWK